MAFRIAFTRKKTACAICGFSCIKLYTVKELFAMNHRTEAGVIRFWE